MSAADFPVAILAGGLATRLRPITEKIPKLLVEVAGEPFFTHQLRLLKKNGLTRIVVCTGHLGEKISAHYGDGKKFGVRLEYSPDGPTLLGTGGAIVQALPRLGEIFYVLYGDSYLEVDYRAVGQVLRQNKSPALMTVCRNENGNEMGNVQFEAGEIVAYDKKHPTAKMHHVDYGLGVFRAAAFAPYRATQPLDLADVQHDLATRKELAGYEVAQRFHEIGSPAGLAQLEAHLRK